MSETKTAEQLEQENYDNMLSAMAEYTMHKDSEQYDDDESNNKTIDDYKKDLESAMDILEQSETNEKGEKIIDTDDYTEDELEALNVMGEYCSFHANDQYEYVVRGALLHCSCGSHHRRLNLPKCHGVYRRGNPLMRSDDCKAGLEGSKINITSFGICNGPGSGNIGQGDISLAPEIVGEDGLPIQGETDGGVITGKRCMASIPSGTWENTHYETQITDEGKFALTTNSFLKCEYGGIIRVVTSGQETVIKDENISDMTQYELPEEAQAEVEKIIASDEDWETKSNKIRQVYEKSLYNYNDEVKEAFDAYGIARATKEQEKIDEAEDKLHEILKETPIDIKAVGRALSEDILRVVPQNNNNLGEELSTFMDLVNTGMSMDLKSQSLSSAIGSSDKTHDFSIWTKGWNGNEFPDYLGNYSYGYLAAGYFRDIDFDNDIITGFALPGTGVAVKATIEALRVTNPDKTDAEIMTLVAAEITQGISDKDSEYCSDGFNDYYQANGLDKNQIIENERKTW